MDEILIKWKRRRKRKGKKAIWNGKSEKKLEVSWFGHFLFEYFVYNGAFQKRRAVFFGFFDLRKGFPIILCRVFSQFSNNILSKQNVRRCIVFLKITYKLSIHRSLFCCIFTRMRLPRKHFREAKWEKWYIVEVY